MQANWFLGLCRTEWCRTEWCIENKTRRLSMIQSMPWKHVACISWKVRGWRLNSIVSKAEKESNFELGWLFFTRKNKFLNIWIFIFQMRALYRIPTLTKAFRKKLHLSWWNWHCSKEMCTKPTKWPKMKDEKQTSSRTVWALGRI